MICTLVWLAMAQAELPRVLIIGDSISVGYTAPVQKLLDGKVRVERIPVNGGPTIRGLEQMEKWLAAGTFDVIHFNFGLHDLRLMDDGQHQVKLEAYAQNLERIVERLRATRARLIWASTTPVPDGKLNPPRSNADVIAYNAAAARVMKKHGIEINDLYAAALPNLALWQRPVNVHFTESGSLELAKRVAARILRR